MPALTGKIRLLEDVPLFSACTRKELTRIAGLASRVSAQPGEILTQEGRPGREFYVVESGDASVTLAGKELATLRAGDFFGEMALLDQGPRAATVRAETPMTLYVISARDFDRLLEEVPFVAKKLLRGLAARLRAAEQAPAYIWNRI